MIPLNPEELNKEFINKLALDNHIVRTALTIYARGDFTYEQALTAMVAWLVNHNEELARLQIERLSTQLPDSRVLIRFGTCSDIREATDGQ